MDKMNKKPFMEELRRGVQDKLGESHYVKLKKIKKNNNVAMQGMLIMTQKSNVTPTIYLDNFYEAYRSGTPLEEILEMILRIYREDTPKRKINLDFFKDFEQVKDRICYKVVNGSYNKELLERIPHVPFLDLAVCFYYAYQGKELGEGSILIYDSHMEMWQTSTAELMKLAQRNTPALFPWELCPMEEVLLKLMQEIYEGEEGESPEEEQKGRELSLRILSNTKRLQGAVSILYPGVLDRIAEEMEGSFYILPSSVHEVLLLPKDCVESGGGLQDIIKEVNRTQLEKQEILSDSLYYYDFFERKIKIF